MYLLYIKLFLEYSDSVWDDATLEHKKQTQDTKLPEQKYVV